MIRIYLYIILLCTCAQDLIGQSYEAERDHICNQLGFEQLS